MNNSAAAGGGANINGVLYQLLWTLLRVSKIGIIDFVSDGAGSVSNAIVVAEPSDGGDVRIDGDHQEVEQLKSRSDGSGWSLQDVIKKVLPDLFLAVSSDSSKQQTFRLISEGGIGDWQSVYKTFFQDLQNREWSAGLESLDDTQPLSTGAKSRKDSKKTFFPDPCTERGLFLVVCEQISQRPAVKKLNLIEQELQRRVWRLLERFEFRDPIMLHEVQSQVDSLLLAVLDNENDVPRVRNHLAMELAKLASSGNAEIVSADFLKTHGVNSLPLSNWAAHRERAKSVLERTLRRRHYESNLDVRQHPLISSLKTRKIIVVAGDSGCGKSWAINSLASKSVAHRNLPILLESRGDGEKDLAKVAEVFWHDIHDGEDFFAFSRIEKRLSAVLGKDSPVGISVFIDGVGSLDEAKSLIEYDWENTNSQLVFSCSNQIAESLENSCPNQVDILTVGQFSWPQLHDYLHRRNGDSWTTIPTDIRSTLLTPLLASFYCDLFGDRGFLVENEYQLYEGVFQSRVSGRLTDTPLDEIAIDKLALVVRDGETYPWTKQQLFETGLDDSRIVRLLKNGWLVQPDDNSYRVFHDRLLNWSIASATERQLASNQISTNAFLKHVANAFQGKPNQHVNLGYVPMDALWMLCTRQPEKTELAVQTIQTLEDHANHRFDDLYDDMVSTLGECVSDALFLRYQKFANSGWPTNVVAKALISTSGQKLESYVKQLLTSDDPLSQRKAVKLAKNSTFPSLVDFFWKVHVASQNDPEKFGEKVERRVFLYQETFRVLKRAATANPAWIDERLSNADKAIDPISDLAWMVASAGDNGELWRKHKAFLISELDESNPRSLIGCIERFRDIQEISRLEKWVSSNDQIATASAIQALSRLDSGKAISLSKTLDPSLMRMCVAWCFREIVERDRENANRVILDWMNEVDDPWDVGLLFAGRENDISVEQLECLLDSLTKQLEARSEDKVGSSFFFQFDFLGRISRLDLIECIRQQNGTNCEKQIEKFLSDLGPHRGSWGMVSGRNGALMTLQLMGARSLTHVINQFLSDDDQHGLLDTIKWAVKAPDEETFRLLIKIVNSEQGWPGTSTAPEGKFIALIQNDALRCLASHGRWKDVADGVKKLGKHLFSGLERADKPVTDGWVEALRDEVGTSPNIGNVFALGIVGGRKDGKIILEVLRQNDPNSDLALHCLVALRDCGYFENDAVAQVAQHLQIEKHRYAATCYLTEAGNETAWDAIISDLEKNFDHINALNLINLSKHAARALQITLKQLPVKRTFAEYQMLEILLTRIHQKDFQEQLLSDEYVQTFLHFEAAKSEGSSWYTGSKESMIRCLALTTKDLAFSACLRCVDNCNAKDRTRYPKLLTEIDEVKALPMLAERLVTEQSVLMKNAILRTLREKDLSVQIKNWKSSENDFRRRAACELLAISTNVGLAKTELSNRLGDRSDDVIKSAVSGLQLLRDRENQLKLRKAIDGEVDRAKRTALIDAFINTCQPGEEHQLLSDEIRETLESLSNFERENAKERLKKRAKKRDDAIERSDKRD